MNKSVVCAVLLLAFAALCLSFASAGQVTNIQASDLYTLLTTDDSTFLVDVRTGELHGTCVYPPRLDPKLTALPPVDADAELRWNGKVDEDKFLQPVIYVSFLLWPDMKPNDDFGAEVMRQLNAHPRFNVKTSKVAFMCCCGGRSKSSAQFMADSYGLNALNMLSGFEGDLNPTTRHRGELNGWKGSKLPWWQI